MEKHVDMLACMLNMQKTLQAALGYSINYMTEPERAAYVKEYALHLVDELGEMLREMPYFKPWKQYPDGFTDENMAKVKNELVDVWHFFMNIMIGLGISAEELYAEYVKKNEENYRRQLDKANYKRCVEE